MKKLLFAAILFAGVGMGLAKEPVQTIMTRCVNDRLAD